MAPGDISNDMQQFFKKLTWATQSIPHTIEEIYDELEAVDVTTTISISKDFRQTIVNTGRAGREELKKQNRDKTYPSHHHKRNKKDKSSWDENRDTTYEACGYSNCEPHRMLKKIHSGDCKECMI